MRCKTITLHIPVQGRRMKLLVLRPADTAPGRLRTGVLWLHGGGYITGMPEMVHFTRARDLAARYGAVVVSPAYRLAGRAPYPAALTDCHAALRFMYSHARGLGIRADRLMVGGESAGGGLAAALCMYEKDTGGIPIAFQMPLYPMLDDRDTATSRDNHAPVWNTRRNHYAWGRYLRGLAGGPCPAMQLRRGAGTTPACLRPTPSSAPPSRSTPRPSAISTACGRPAYRRNWMSTPGCSTHLICCCPSCR